MVIGFEFGYVEQERLDPTENDIGGGHCGKVGLRGLSILLMEDMY